MSQIMTRRRVPVKATRTNPRPPLPFGLGLIDDELDDSEYEALALQDEWDRHWESADLGRPLCFVCGKPTEELTSGACDRCAMRLELGLSIEEDATCVVCREPHEALSEFGLCDRCETLASERHSFSGPRGF